MVSELVFNNVFFEGEKIGRIFVVVKQPKLWRAVVAAVHPGHRAAADHCDAIAGTGPPDCVC